jgi:CRP/FNR family cyclic AMP-dependent transcriptional regulator
VREELRSAIACTCLADLPADAISPLFQGAERVLMPAGLRSGPDDVASISIVVTGLMRIARAGPDGRSITQRYTRRGDIAGIVGIFNPRSARSYVQSIIDSVQYMLHADAWRETARHDARVAFAIIQELARIHAVTNTRLSGASLASMRQRVARELFDIAADAQQGTELVAPVTQQEIADGIGSTREVVARALRELREGGAVETRRHGIVIVDPEALRAELDEPV